MKPATLRLLRPENLDEALALLASHGEAARPLAGGQTLMPMMNLRLSTPGILVDLNRITALGGISVAGDQLRIGAMTRQKTLLEDPLVALHAPLLHAAARHIGHAQTRNRGTIGGSLAHADPAAELPLVMATLDARLTLMRAGATREVPARDFFLGALTTALLPCEIIAVVSLPLARPAQRCAFREIARRLGDFAIVAAAVRRDASGLTAGVGGLAAQPLVCTAPDAETLRNDVAAVLADAEALSDLQASGTYRRHLAGVLLDDCLAEVSA